MGTACRISEEYFKENPPQYSVVFENCKTKQTFEEKFPNSFFYEKRMNRVNRGTSLKVVDVTKYF